MEDDRRSHGGPHSEAVIPDERSFTFFFPYHQVSGVPVLFLTLARHLSETTGRKVRVVDYVDGFMARSLCGSDRVELIPFEHGRKCTISGQTILVMQSILPYRAYPELSIQREVTLLFWHLFPTNLFFVLAPLRRIRELALYRPRLYRLLMRWLHPVMDRAIKNYFRTLNDQNGIVYYDLSTIEVTASVLETEVKNPILVAVPIEVPDEPTKRPRLRPRSLVVAWIGRLCDFKIHILLHTVNRFSKWALESGTEVEFQVIGEGEEGWRLDHLPVANPHFKLRRMGIISGDQLHQHMLDHVDLVTAMGQSALESGRLGVPTLLLDFTYREIRSHYRFRWLHRSSRGDLGHLITERDEEDADGLPALMETLRTDYLAQIVLTHEYCLRNHDIRVVAKTFRTAADASRLTVEHIPPAVRRRGVVRKLYNRFKYGRLQ